MYLSWNEKKLTDFSNNSIESAYNDGFVFTRIGKGIMNQTRSLRIDLSKFELSSENRRILGKTEELVLSAHSTPYTQYEWTIHKMGKEFYGKKFGEKTPALNRPAGSGLVFSAQKIKELITDKDKSNFNKLLVYSVSLRGATSDAAIPMEALSNNGIASLPKEARNDSNSIGYCISLETEKIFHYCYPFYDLESNYQNIGMGMMLKAIAWAKENSKKYFYLGSFQRPSDVYKLQFSGLEWFDGTWWHQDTDKLKEALKNVI